MESTPVRDKLVIINDTKLLSQVREFMSRTIRASALPPEDENKVILAVDEAVSNIIEHGYEDDTQGEIEIEVEADAERFKIRVKDKGKNFDPGSMNKVDILEHVKAGRKKGLGIFLMRQIMDEVRYIFREGVENELTLVKYCRPAKPAGQPGA